MKALAEVDLSELFHYADRYRIRMTASQQSCEDKVFNSLLNRIKELTSAVKNKKNMLY